MSAVVLLLAIVVGVLALLVIGLLRSHAEILRALHDAGISLDPDREHDHDHSAGRGGARAGRAERSPSGTPTFTSDTPPTIRTTDGVPEPAGSTGRRAVDIAGITPNGGTRTVSIAPSDQATLLAFLTTGCATCADFWGAFAEGVELPADTRLVVVTQGPETESPADVAAMAAPHVLTIQSTDAWDDYGVPVAPYFALVDGRRGVVVGEGAASSWDRVRTLLDRALADAGYGAGQVRRRDLLLGKARTERVDRDLARAGLSPGDPRLFHEPVVRDEDADPGEPEQPRP
ncbi:hypothetical protein NHL50_09685 [Acidimicrobiia bacterium EGI L10123]|uniref:TlpA family protein disulfide reductase n=1 Tax=Salinilacustrithrix flava TaxID=2957203 RepID=UPI003D7C329A|nr:hypothetical protein [Acidimicrobiia bacterium EGI L10123]